MARVLMVCYYFPPLGGMGSVRAAKFAVHLSEFGWEPVVVAPLRGASYKDSSLMVPRIHVYRTSNLQAGQLIGRGSGGVGDSSAKGGEDGFLRRLRNLAHRTVYRPDGQVGWYPFAIRAARRAIRIHNPDLIFSSSFPITAHLVARQLHRESGIPWVAEFRDLWTEWGAPTPGRQRANEALESSILGEASEVITVSPACAEALRARDRARVSVVTNGFDEAEFPGSEPAEDASIIITYLGTYYPGHQDLGPTLRAIGTLVDGGVMRGARVRFVGQVPAALRGVIAETGLTVEETGLVLHAESVRLIRTSTNLLHAGVTSVATNALRGILPGKTFEYLGARRPILFVGHPDGDAAKLMRGFPLVRIVRPDDDDGIRSALLSLLTQETGPRPPGLEPYTSRSVTRDLARVFDRARNVTVRHTNQGGRGEVTRQSARS
jgi:hypothetical protein